MKKRFFASVLSLVMLLSLLPTAAFAAETDTGLPAADSNGVITLTSNVTLSEDVSGTIMVDTGSTVVLDLSGKNITASSGCAIINKGNLTIKGTGTVSTTAAESAAIANFPGATCTVEGGTYQSSAWYTIKNLGTMTLGGTTAVTTTNEANVSSLIDNGWYGSSDKVAGETISPTTNSKATLTINGGEFSCTGGQKSCSVVKNDDYGTLIINNGTFDSTANTGASNAATILNWNVAIINNGTFKGQYPLSNGYCGSADVGQLTVNGGTFTGTSVILGQNGDAHDSKGLLKITGGTFNAATFAGNADAYTYAIEVSGGTFPANSNVGAYLADGYTVDANGKVVPKAEKNENDVAEVNGQYFTTLSGAVAAAKSGDTVKLLKECETGTLTISKNITLDLGTHTLRIVKTDGGKVFGLAFVNNTATVQNGTIIDTRSQADNSAGWMAVLASNAKLTTKNVTVQSYCPTSKSAYNYIIFLQLKASLTLEQGTVIKDIVGSATSENSYGVVGVAVLGTSNSKEYTETTNLVVNGGSINTWAYALSGNGTSHGTDITINGGDITSRESGAIYHPQAGKLTMNGGVLTGKTGVQLCSGEATTSTDFTFNGGTVRGTGEDERANKGTGDGIVSDGAAISLVNRNYPGGAPKITINGGSFASANNDAVIAYTWGGGQATKWEQAKEFLTITAGLFSSDPSAYCVDGMTGVANDDSATNSKYPFTVGKANTEAPAVVVAGKPDVKSEISDSATEEEKKLAESAAAALAPADSSAASAAIAGAGIEAAAKEIANDNTIKGDAYKTQLNTEKDVKIVVQHYMDIQVTDATSADTEKSLTLDITPMYRKVATTVDPSEDPSAEIKTDGNDKNAVQITTGELSIIGPVTLTLPLPTDFVNDDATVYIQHKGYEYTATVKSNVITFVNPHGFSEFTISTKSIAVAKIGETSYTSLQAAVDAVKDDETITLLKDGEATVSRTVTFNIKAENSATATINEGSRTTVNQSEPDGNGVTTYTCTRSSSGSGSGTTTYAITTNSPANGTVTASPKSAAKGATVTLTVAPTEGYQLDKLTVADKDGKEITLTDKGNGKYTFTMPASKVEVTATFKQAPVVHVCPAEKYTDVDTTQWYHEGVDYVIANGMMNGTGTNTFEPNSTTTRGMIVTILYRLEKEPAAGTSPFTDVDAGQWYAKAVAWAAANGVVNGTSPTTFNPNDPITREQMAAILYRYASFKGYDVTGKADLAGFTDAAQISAYAKDAMSWANKAGLIGGVSATTLQPQGSATRAQVATILMRFCENVAK